MTETTRPTVRRDTESGTPTGELWLRRIAAAVLLYLQFQGMLGLAWDIEWHRSVGRDAFLTPPHILLHARFERGEEPFPHLLDHSVVKVLQIDVPLVRVWP